MMHVLRVKSIIVVLPKLGARENSYAGDKMVKVGLIGCGGIADAHLKVFKSMKNVDVTGICDLNLEKAKSVARKYKVEKTFADYNDLFEVKDLGLVDICTPISTHARIVCDAARAVPAILVEKPMALSVVQCDEMIKETKKHGTKLCISQQLIFLPSIEKAKLLIDNGAFNLVSFVTRQKASFKVLKAYGLASDWMVAPEQGGIIWEVCTHLAYLQLHFLQEFQEIYAIGEKVKYPVYDNFAVLLRTNDQRFGVIELSWVSKETEVTYEMSDSTGKRVQVYQIFDYFLENKADSPFSAKGALGNFFSDENRVLQKWIKFGSNYAHKRKLIPHFKLIGNYLVSIEKDLPPPVTPEDGRKTVNLLECIKKSLDEHQPVMVSP
jgi:UDP-N-acetyl-2-amino-2-deoxyglucuronate dehydrogenase